MVEGVQMAQSFVSPTFRAGLVRLVSTFLYPVMRSQQTVQEHIQHMRHESVGKVL